MHVAVNSHALPIYKKNRIASLLCIFETTIKAYIVQMELGVVEMRLIFCGKHPLLVTRTQVSDPGTMGHLVYL